MVIRYILKSEVKSLLCVGFVLSSVYDLCVVFRRCRSLYSMLNNVAICMANDVWTLKSTPLARSSNLVEPGSRPSTFQSVESHGGEIVKEVKNGGKLTL